MSSPHGIDIGYCSGRIGGAIGAVGAPAEDDDVLQSLDIQGRSQDEFLISPPEALPANGHRGLPSGDDTGGWADGMTRFYDFLCNSRMDSGHLLGLPLYKSGEDEGFISHFPCPLLRRFDRDDVTSDNYVVRLFEDGITSFRRFLDFSLDASLNPILDGFGDFFREMIFSQDGHTFAKGALIGNGGSRTDDIQRITDHIG